MNIKMTKRLNLKENSYRQMRDWFSTVPLGMAIILVINRFVWSFFAESQYIDLWIYTLSILLILYLVANLIIIKKYMSNRLIIKFLGGIAGIIIGFWLCCFK